MTETTAFNYVNLENLCRVCCRSDLGVHLASSEEITAIQMLTLEPYFPGMDPLFLCLYCSAVLKKSVLFVKQCSKAHEFIQATAEERAKSLPYNNMTKQNLNTISIISSNEDIKDVTTKTVDYDGDADHHFEDDNDDDLPLTMWKTEDSEKEIENQPAAVSLQRDEDEKIFKKMKKKRHTKSESNLNQDTKLKTTSMYIPSADNKPLLAEGVNANGSVFSKRMVRETQQYLVIKLTKDQVLQEIKENLLSEKYLSSRYQCGKCAKDFNFEDVLRNHMEKHSKKSGNLCCELCEQYFPTPVSLRGHMKSHTTRYKCKLCGVIKKSRQHLLEHYTLSHCADSVKYTCDLCPFVTDKRTVIQRHTRTHWPTKGHICDMCGRSCKTLEALRVHRIRHDASKQFQCPSCPRRFVYPTLLKRHVREAHELAHNYCVECDRTFTAKETLQNHFKKSKKHRDTPAHECKSCSAKFDTRSQLASHRTREHGEPAVVYHCDSCPKKYQCKNTLRSHIRRVHNKLVTQKRHTCNQCDKEFTQKHSLTRHLRIHTYAPRRRHSTHTKKPETEMKIEGEVITG